MKRRAHAALSVLVATGALVTPACALAQDAVLPAAPAAQTPASSGVTAVLSLTGATDYVWRGESQTNEKPVVFLEVDLTAGRFYLDVRTENVDFSGVKQEYDSRGGYVVPLGKFKLDMGYVRYGFINAPVNFDTLEGTATLSRDIGKVNVHAGIYYTGNYFAAHRAGEYYELGASWTVNPKVAISGVLGHQDVDRTLHYNTWNVGVDYTWRKGIDLTVLYADTDTQAFGPLARSRIVASLAFAF